MDPADQLWLAQFCLQSECVYAVMEVPSYLRGSIDSNVAKSAKEVSVGRLTDAAIAEIARRGQFLSEEQVARVVRLADGSPYYAQNICYVLWQKHLHGEDDQMPDILDRLDVPDLKDRLGRVHQEVLDGLPDSARRACLTLGIAPQVFTEVLARGFTGMHPSQFRAAWRDLVARRIVISVSSKSIYRLYHGQFREFLREQDSRSLEAVARQYIRVARLVASAPDVLILLYEKYDDRRLLKRLARIVADMDSLNTLAERLFVNGRSGEAMDTWWWLGRVAAKKRDRGWQTAALGNVALILQRQGVWQKALRVHRAVLRAFRRARDRRNKAGALCNIGNIYSAKGEPDKALRNYEEALAIHREVGYRQGVANDLGNIGNIYSAKGEPDKALKNYEEALAIHREVGYRQGVANQLGNIGGIYSDKGEPDKALKYHEEALAIHREVGYRQGVASDIGNIGGIYSAKGEPDKALKNYEEARQHRGYLLGQGRTRQGAEEL